MGATRRWRRRVQYETIQRGRIHFVLPVIPDGAPHALKEALATRRRANLTGKCSCGAELELRRVAPGLLRGKFVHEDDCPAVATELTS